MKKLFRCFALLAAFALLQLPAGAQADAASPPVAPPATSPADIILTREGDEIAARVEEVRPDTIIYRPADNPQGAVRSIPRADVFRIRYANGTRDVFGEAGAAPVRRSAPGSAGLLPSARAYVPTGELARLPSLVVPDSIRNDPFRNSYFERGRYVGHAAFGRGARRSDQPPVLAAADLPLDEWAAYHADAAYRYGYRRQMDRDRAGRADTTAGILSGGLFLLILLLGASIGGG